MKTTKAQLKEMIREAVKKQLGENYFDSDADPELADAADDLISMAMNLAHQIDYKPEFGHPDPNIERKKAALEIINEAERQLSDEIEEMARSW